MTGFNLRQWVGLVCLTATVGAASAQAADGKSRASRSSLKKKPGVGAPASSRKGRSQPTSSKRDAPRPSQAAPKNDAPRPREAPTPKTMVQPALDLSSPPAAGSDDSARQEILGPGQKASSAGTIDFGSEGATQADGMTFEFGAEQSALDMGNLGAQSPERTRFEAAMNKMSDEDYSGAALEFTEFLSDKAFADYQPESQYQLGKAMYRLGFFEAALRQYDQILEVGVKHPRYRKAVEWLFFISRKIADQTPVMAQLARYRNVTFPKAYRSEYNYLLAKYLYLQANTFEIKRLRDDELQRGKGAKENSLDFSAIAGAIDEGNKDVSMVGGAQLLEGDKSAGSMDFGAPEAAAGGLDFDAPKSGGAMDFGSGDEPKKPDTQGPPTTAKEAVRQGLEMVEQVGNDSPLFARSRYLAGLLHYFDGHDQKAVEAFLDVARLLNPRETASPDPKLREMAFMSLARLHYGYKQFNRSVHYYELIDRDSENWLTSLFEASWAYFRRGDFEKALGNLMTLHAPFFEREYFPESQLVKAIIYFEACRYPETRLIVDSFIKTYTALLHEIEKIAQSPQAVEATLGKAGSYKAGQKGTADQDDVTTRVINLTLSNPDIRQAQANLLQVTDQRKRLGSLDDVFRQSKLGTSIADQLARAEEERRRVVGDIARNKFEREVYNLKSLLGQALRIEIEVTRAERDVLEKRMQNVATDDALVQAPERVIVDDDHLFWPYEDEYWRDELGTYEFDFSMCRQLDVTANQVPAGGGRAGE